MSTLLVPPKATVLERVRAQRARTIALLESLTPEDWEKIVTPRWRVREVAAHLISTDEAAVTGRMLMLGFKGDVGDIEVWNDRVVQRWADRPVPALLHALERWGRILTRVMRAVPARAAAAPFPTPLGKVSLDWLGMMRVYDEWVHGEDVRRVFGLPSDDAREVIEPVARHMLAVLPTQTLPRVGRTVTGRVAIVYDDLEVPPFGIDLAAHKYGYAIADPDAVIHVRAAPFVMVAARRDAWRDAEAAGTLRIEGARDTATALLDVIRAV